MYTAAYDFGLAELMPPQPLVLDADSYADLLSSGRPVIFFGDGMPKARTLFENAPNAVFADDVEPLAVDMVALAEQAYSRRDFADTAYAVPFYLKEFQATKPKNRL